MDHSECALALKHQGMNCCQAVLCAFSEEAGLSLEMAEAIGAPFGGGMGCMEGTCGALCGAEMALGLTKYDGSPIRLDASALHERFRTECGASICKELKGAGTGKMLCSCDDCVKNAAAILDQMLFQNT